MQQYEDLVGYRHWSIIYVYVEFALLPKGTAKIEDEWGWEGWEIIILEK
jgi:hypothetical protein